MDLEALTSEQLELALKLADILSMEDLTVAAAVLSSFNWNIEVHLNLSSKQSKSYKSVLLSKTICPYRKNPQTQKNTTTT